MTTQAALSIALAIGTLSAPGLQPSVSAAPAYHPSPLMLDKGDKGKPEKEKTDKEKQDDALRVIADAADRVVGPSGYAALMDLIASNDRERLESKARKGDVTRLADSAKNFMEVWRAKYGGKNFAAVKNFDQLKGMRVELRDNAESNRQYAFIYFPAFGGWAPFEMHLTRSGGSTWRIQIPNDVDGEKLAKDVSRDVAKLVTDKDRWPSDEFLGYNNAVTQLVHALSFPSDKPK